MVISTYKNKVIFFLAIFTRILLIIEILFMGLLIYADFHIPNKSWRITDWPVSLFFASLLILPLLGLILSIISRNKISHIVARVIAFGILVFWIFIITAAYYGL